MATLTTLATQPGGMVNPRALYTGEEPCKKVRGRLVASVFTRCERNRLGLSALEKPFGQCVRVPLSIFPFQIWRCGEYLVVCQRGSDGVCLFVE